MRGVWGTGRDSRYSGARRGMGIRGALGAPRGCRGPFWGCHGSIRGCQGCIGVASGLGAQPHWGPVQGPSTPTGSPGGVTDLAKTKEVTEISSVGYYIHLELYFKKVVTFVSMIPHHIFLYAILRNVIWTVFSADQFMHILT